MTPLHLATHHTRPIEREYEAWIVAGIESYLSALNLKYSIWAVTPSVEAKWPADEQLQVAGKVVGLQFKQAKLEAGTVGFDRLKWVLHQPSSQFALILGNPEIFYCLPTFINRQVRSRALDHCLFWRPDQGTDYNAWYDNPKAHTPYKQLKTSMRWGAFLEALLSCKVGKLVEPSKAPQNVIAQLVARILEADGDQGRSDSGEGLYLLFIELGI